MNRKLYEAPAKIDYSFSFLVCEITREQLNRFSCHLLLGEFGEKLVEFKNLFTKWQKWK